MTTQLAVTEAEKLKKDLEIEPTEMEKIIVSFAPVAKEIGEYEADFKKIMSIKPKDITDEVCKQAKALRLKYRDARTAGNDIHKDLKSDLLKKTRGIDGMRNIYKLQITEKESKLSDLETHFERIEAEKIKELEQSRIEELTKYGMDDPSSLDLGNMKQSLYDSVLAGQKSKHAADLETIKQAEIEEARLAKIADLKKSRQDMIYKKNVRSYFEDDYFEVIGELDESEFNIALDKVLDKKAAADQKAADDAKKLADENTRLAREQAEADKKAAKVQKELDAANAAKKEKEELDAAAKEQEAKDAKNAESASKNKAYTDWLEKNGVDDQSIRHGLHQVHKQPLDDGKTEFTIVKVISTIII